jgi:electron transport complex protein RnfG
VLLAGAYHATLPAIEANRAAAEREAVNEVLRSPARFETLFDVDGRLVTEPPAGRDSKRLPKVFRGYDAEGRVVGYAVVASATGYADQVTVMFGWDVAANRLLGMTVLESRETPGLGDKVGKPDFTSRVVGRETPLVGVKTTERKGNPGEVDTITGATISSRAVIKAINEGVTRWGPVLRSAGTGDGKGGG